MFAVVLEAPPFQGLGRLEPFVGGDPSASASLPAPRHRLQPGEGTKVGSRPGIGAAEDGPGPSAALRSASSMCYETSMLAAIYHRVSTRDQDETGPLDQLREAALRRGLKIVLEVSETGSGSRADRPGWSQILRRRGLDFVVVWALDRAGRSALDLLAQIRQLQRRGVTLVSVSQGLEIGPHGSHTDSLVLTMLAAIAEFERDIIRDRTRAGLVRARARGKRLGRPPTQRPTASSVARLRALHVPWREVASALGCTVWAARSALKGPTTRSCLAASAHTGRSGSPTSSPSAEATQGGAARGRGCKASARAGKP